MTKVDVCKWSPISFNRFLSHENNVRDNIHDYRFGSQSSVSKNADSSKSSRSSESINKSMCECNIEESNSKRSHINSQKVVSSSSVSGSKSYSFDCFLIFERLKIFITSKNRSVLICAWFGCSNIIHLTDQLTESITITNPHCAML